MWEAFKDFIFWVIAWLYSIVGDWGMAIILITLIFRALLTPLVYKQTKSSYYMQKIQPEVNRIKERFPDDPTRQNQETQKLYAETKFNPLAGCVPMLIQMPIFIALFQVLRDMNSYVPSGSDYVFYNLIPDLTQTPAGAWAVGWPVWLPYIILMVIFAGATFVPMILQQMQSGQQDAQQRNTMIIMAVVMSAMMLWIGWGSPAGVLLFWGVSSLLAIAQQQVSRHFIIKKDVEEHGTTELQYQKEIVVERKEKAKRPKKKR